MDIKIEKGKITAMVLFGGKSVEHDVSIISGVQLLHALDKNKFNVIPVYIDKDGHWLMSKRFTNISILAKNQPQNYARRVTLSQSDHNLYLIKNHGLKKLFKIDFVFSTLHGGSGEDGRMSAFLDMCDLPYSSSDCRSSNLTYDKFLTKLICEKYDIPVVEYAILNECDRKKSIEDILGDNFKHLTFPMIVKPTALGSSVGITYCRDKNTLKDAIDFAFLFCNSIIVERAVENLREFNVSVISDGLSSVELSATEEVRHSKDFLSFEDKYMDNGEISGSNERQIPAIINMDIQIKMEELAKKVTLAMGFCGVVRIDFLFDETNGQIYINEINSIPGSMANYLWRVKGITYTSLLNKLYDIGMSNYNQKKEKVTHFSSSILSKFANSKKMNFKK